MSLSSVQLKIFLYVPNLIGYTRVLLTCYSFYMAEKDWKVTMLCYSISFICDYFDGLFARALNQCTI